MKNIKLYKPLQEVSSKYLDFLAQSYGPSSCFCNLHRFPIREIVVYTMLILLKY